MAPRGQLHIGYHDDEAAENSKRIPMKLKAKENTAYSATDSSCEGKTVMESTEIETTRTSRGRTRLDKLVWQRVQGIRKDVRFNKIGQPIGEFAGEMQSYIGVLAREKIKISYKTWKQVPSDVKESIWESVNLTYNIDPSWKKGCLNSANNKWRQYKAHLTQKFIFSKLDKPEELKKPPSGYGITRDDWSSFVISRMSDDFMKVRAEQKRRRKQNIYPHRLSRKGYARFADEIAGELCDDDEINRAIIWKKGRVDKKGQVEGDDLKMAIEKINDYVQQKREGKLHFEGAKKDILTKVFDSDEHAGHARGVGAHITPTIYFNVGRIWKSPPGDGHLLFQHKKEELEAKILISEQHQRIAEQNARLADQNARLVDQNARILKLEEMFKKGACDFDIDEKGSCSVKLHPISEGKVKTEESASNYETFNDDDMQVLSKDDFLQGKPVALTLESNTNIVAYGTIVHVNGAGKLRHGVPLPVNCMRFSIDEAVEKLAHLPFPISNECDTIGDAVGTHVAWPAHLVKMQDEKSRRKQNVDKRSNPVLPSSVPRSLNILYFYCKHALDHEKNISMIFDHDFFDEDYELLVHLEDIIPFYHLEPISTNCIVVYMWHLYRKMKRDNKLDKFRFMNPHTIPYMPYVTRLDKKGKIEHLNERASVLADRLSGASRNQLVLVPLNVGCHWILTVVDPYMEVVYLLDSLSHRNRYEDWKYVVNMSLRLFNSNKEMKGRKQAIWKVVKGPRQPDAKQCGFYVMRFMREIIEGNATSEKDSLSSIITLWKKLMKCVLNGRNAYKIIFMTRDARRIGLCFKIVLLMRRSHIVNIMIENM
ncbi:uncharacterized protein [Henckelia pumila]|uniref:uncharacterized protein isoform X2 n=1 Tax=Henckelia pumila TaxID=405737 RepID=UPI003C6E4201